MNGCDRKFDLQLLSQCGSSHICSSRSVAGMHKHVAGTLSKQATNKQTLPVCLLVPPSPGWWSPLSVYLLTYAHRSRWSIGHLRPLAIALCSGHSGPVGPLSVCPTLYFLPECMSVCQLICLVLSFRAGVFPRSECVGLCKCLAAAEAPPHPPSPPSTPLTALKTVSTTHENDPSRFHFKAATLMSVSVQLSCLTTHKNFSRETITNH